MDGAKAGARLSPAMIYGSIAFGLSDHNHPPLSYSPPRVFFFLSRCPPRADILRTGCPVCLLPAVSLAVSTVVSPAVSPAVLPTVQQADRP